jgi:hypothetical protein
MEITITRTGGLQGVRQILGPVSTDDLAESDSITQLIDEMKFFDLPAQIPSGGGADIFFYRTVVVDTNRSHEVLSDDLSEEPYHGQLGRLIDLLNKAGIDYVDQASGKDADWDEVKVVPLFVWGVPRHRARRRAGTHHRELRRGSHRAISGLCTRAHRRSPSRHHHRGRNPVGNSNAARTTSPWPRRLRTDRGDQARIHPAAGRRAGTVLTSGHPAFGARR